MRITVSVTKLNLDVPKHLAKVRSDEFWTFAASEWHRLYRPYVPMRTGSLADTVTIAPKTITHTAPYAHYQYTGAVYGPNYPITQGGAVVGFFSKKGKIKRPTGAALHYRRDLHPLASREWDKAAAPTQGPRLAAAMQAYINSGRLNLNG